MATTRDKILESAWRLFSEEGFESVSVRDVTNDAGVNLASVSYHFSGKEGLILEIVGRALAPLNKQRVILLKQAGEEIGNLEDIPLDKIITAFVRPVICPEEFGGCSKMIAQIMARYLIDPDHEVPSAVMESFADVYKIFGVAIASQCPEINAAKALEGMMFSSGAVFMFQSFSNLATKVAGLSGEKSVEEFLEEAVKFCAAGFVAK